MPELKVENERDNKLLHRREIQYRIVFKNEATPSREKIKEIIAKNTGSKKELIIIPVCVFVQKYTWSTSRAESSLSYQFAAFY